MVFPGIYLNTKEEKIRILTPKPLVAFQTQNRSVIGTQFSGSHPWPGGSPKLQL